ncbi:MAG TPA: dihydroxyacetone kinase subunit DhaL [Amaricoccus sp.]|nr:dihydroxyacetone kinase subunit DhaL [Amaricoccus sp.]
MGVDGDGIREMVAAIAAAMEANRDELCRLDGVIGDADHGIAMAGGFGAARDAVLAMEPLSEPTAVLNMAAKAFLNAGGGSSGPLYATALMRAAAAVKGKAALEGADVVAMLQAMAVGIRDRGKAEPGQKTMLDAWAPAALAAGEAQAAGKDLAGCLDAAVAAAKAGAEATKAMMPGKGRAERLGERAVGHVDPGAASAVLVIEAIRQGLAG